MSGLSDSLGSVTASVAYAAIEPGQSPFDNPDTELDQYADEDGPTAVSMMQAQIDAVQEYADPEIEAPICRPLKPARLTFPPITDLLNGAVILVDLPEMPDIQLEIPPVLSDVINAATQAYGEISGALAGVMPMLGQLQGMVDMVAGLPNAIMGEIAGAVAGQIGGVLGELGALGPINTALALGGQAMQVHSALSMLANGNISSPAMLGNIASTLGAAAANSPALSNVLGPVANTLSSAANQAISAVAPFAGAASQIAFSASAISNAVSNPSAMTPATIATASASMVAGVQGAINSLS